MERALRLIDLAQSVCPITLLCDIQGNERGVSAAILNSENGVRATRLVSPRDADPSATCGDA